MEVETTPLLGQQSAKSEHSSWIKKRLFAGMALTTAISGLGLQFHHRGEKLHAISADLRASMQSVFDALVTNNSHYQVECPNSEYAYCGHASCKASEAPGIAACGCKMYTDNLGTFEMDIASTTLIRSQTYREAVLLSVDGHEEVAKTKVCAALLDGSIWAEAGYGATSFGSFYHTKRRLSSREGEFLSAHSVSSGEHGSCMGSPCLSLNWGDGVGHAGCSVTCLCPDYRSSDDDTEKDGCFKNGILSYKDESDLVWAKSLDSLLKFTTELAKLLDTFDHKALEAAGTCSACTIE